MLGALGLVMVMELGTLDAAGLRALLRERGAQCLLLDCTFFAINAGHITGSINVRFSTILRRAWSTSSPTPSFTAACWQVPSTLWFCWTNAASPWKVPSATAPWPWPLERCVARHGPRKSSSSKEGMKLFQLPALSSVANSRPPWGSAFP
ncbi:Hypothetical predicted protein [Marmota monax]|uniref:Rhodanese domain-containing protein n=1 Tax=Marmota monax TaxID=9995 RepID=A0A5E4CBT2_MARMO|nr:hypothetical protein GHT09_007533 [Marmota monax]VTJ78619.1 Hypothetical predicted protein [Marmota monax]